jgi:hypothetical protein
MNGIGIYFYENFDSDITKIGESTGGNSCVQNVAKFCIRVFFSLLNI